jgi:hypothetical protein
MATSSRRMTRRTKKTTKSNRAPPPAWHPHVRALPSNSRRTNAMQGFRWFTVLCGAAVFDPLGIAFLRAQEPAAPPSPSAPEAQTPAASPSKSGRTKYSRPNDFLIHGTVFNEKALSFPGVQLRIRRAGEKKFHWESFTNSRGEFAVRVPQGSNYELVVRAKGFAEQTRTIDAKIGEDQENVVFRMRPAAGDKQ